MGALILAASLMGGPAAAAPQAYVLLETLLAMGQRHAGAPRRGQALGLMERLLRERGLEVTRQSFRSPDPKTGRVWEMTNLVGRLRPKAGCRFLLGTHFDTRHVAEEDPDPAKRALPIEGANDGTSGLAVLLALAGRLKAVLPPRIGADIVLFDGEEMGYPGVGGYFAGSREFARRLTGFAAKPKFGIILDMVCDPRGIYRPEAHSRQAHPALVDALWDIGAHRLPGAFDKEPGFSIGDDHLPLSEAGVPSVLVIGFNYPEWHTAADVKARCSAERMERLGAALEEFLRARLDDFLGGCAR